MFIQTKGQTFYQGKLINNKKMKQLGQFHHNCQKTGFNEGGLF